LEERKKNLGQPSETLEREREGGEWGREGRGEKVRERERNKL
jgi:hypothetical protein